MIPTLFSDMDSTVSFPYLWSCACPKWIIRSPSVRPTKDDLLLNVKEWYDYSTKLEDENRKHWKIHLIRNFRWRSIEMWSERTRAYAILWILKSSGKILLQILEMSKWAPHQSRLPKLASGCSTFQLPSSNVSFDFSAVVSIMPLFVRKTHWLGKTGEETCWAHILWTRCYHNCRLCPIKKY